MPTEESDMQEAMQLERLQEKDLKQMTANQRKKHRKKLAKLFSTDDGGSEHSGMQEAASVCTQPAPSVNVSQCSAYGKLAKCAAGADEEGSTCTAAAAAMATAATAAVVAQPAIHRATGPQGHRHIPVGLPPRHLPPRPHHTMRGPADLSSFMHIIASEMRVLESSRSAVLGAPAAGAGPGPSSSGRGFCRINLSQELSVISAELSMSGRTCEGSSDSEGGGEAAGLGRQQQQQQQQQREAGAPASASARRPKRAADDGQAPDPMDLGREGGEPEQAAPSSQQEAAPAAGAPPGGGKRRKKMFTHGNYHNYYGYRALGSFEEDPRLSLFQASWFQGRDLLDIGCNEGLVTLAVAARFGCRRTTGVDIDNTLIKRAMSNLKEMRLRLSQQLSNSRRQGTGPAEVSGHASALADAIIRCSGSQRAAHSEALPTPAQGPAQGPALQSAQAGPSDGVQHGSAGAADGAGPSSQDAVDALVLGGASWQQQQQALRHTLKSLGHAQFKCQDWSKGRTKEQSYDTIMCLSVTKWIHLNGGDKALKGLFKKMFDSLTPGGFLVLEPQPWRSYRSAITKKQTCDVPFRQIEQLQLRPEAFLQHLTEVVGFVHVADLNASSTAQHFDRPLYILQRPAAAPPAVSLLCQ